MNNQRRLLVCALMLSLLGWNVAASTRCQAEDGESPAVDVASPREEFNLGSKALSGDLEDAERLLTSARQRAGNDGELRFRSTYNLGWLEVRRADAIVDENPEDAIKHLLQAAGWFRETVRLRGDFDDARHNLEIVLRRIAQLRDQLAEKEEKDLASRLDEAIAAQRAVGTQIRMLLQRQNASDEPTGSDAYRREFQTLAVTQRTRLSDLQDVTEEVAREFESLQGKPDDERTPEESIRMVQLAGVSLHVGQGSQRIGQSRSQLRRKDASRAFRRSVTGLAALKRARDQLRNPLELIDGLLTDTSSLTQETRMATAGDSITAENVVPPWIDSEYLLEGQRDLSERTSELTARLQAGLDSQTDVESAEEAELSPEQAEFLRQLNDAMPFLNDADSAMTAATESVELKDYETAGEHQVAAIEALSQARERFADLKTLIEITYASANGVRGLFQQLAEVEAPQLLEQAVELAAENHEQNVDRIERLTDMVRRQLANLTTEEQPPAEADAEPESDPERERLETADALLLQAAEQAQALSTTLAGLNEEIDSEGINTATNELAPLVGTLQDLRRLFFTIVEHLRETAQRQTQLNDETETLAGTEEADESSEEKRGKLAATQAELAGVSGEIAEVLKQQADTMAQSQTQPPQQQDAPPLSDQQQAMIEDSAAAAAEAAELVAEAREKMEEATRSLESSESGVAEARPTQDDALQKLLEALARLQPPEENEQQDQQQSQSQPEQGNNQQGDQQGNQPQDQSEQNSPTEQEQQQQQETEQKMDPSRVLQAVRDREAQRRQEKEQERQRGVGQIPVTKDW